MSARFNGYHARKTCPLCLRDIDISNEKVLNRHYDQRTGKECPASGHTLAEAAKLASEKTAEATR